MTKFTDIFFFDYFETKKTQTGEEPQYRFDGPRAPEDLRYYMNRSNIFGKYVKFDHVIFERFKVSINIHRLYFRDTSQSQFRLISCTRSFLLMNVRPIETDSQQNIPTILFKWTLLGNTWTWSWLWQSNGKINAFDGISMNGEGSWAYQLTLFKYPVTRFGLLGQIKDFSSDW